MKRKFILFGVLLLLLAGSMSLGAARETHAQSATTTQDLPYQTFGDGLYVVNNGTYQSMFLVSGEGVIVVDAPPSSIQLVLDTIANVTDEPITHVVYSHSHSDHIGGASLLPADATYIAHEETLSQLEHAFSSENSTYGVFVGGGPVPLPTVTFTDSYTLEVGNQVLELEYRGINHIPGNIYIYAPQQKVLMLVDVIAPGWVPYADLFLSAYIPGFYAAHDEVLSYDFDVFVGGHLTRIGTRRDVEMQREYIMDVRENAIASLRTVRYGEIAQEVGSDDQWRVVDTFLDAVAQNCADATLADWRGRLRGADAFTYSHCWALANSLRLD